MFNEPESDGGRVNPRDVVGHLLLVWPVEYLDDRPTQFSRPDKPSDVIVVDVVDLDVTDETGAVGVLAQRVWWRQAKLIAALRKKIGIADPVLARMGKGAGTQGRNAPFVLVSATGDPGAVQKAKDWMGRNPGFTPSQPENLAYVQPVAVPYEEPELATATSAMSTGPAFDHQVETTLQRLARMAAEGRDRLPTPPSQQGDIPF